MLPVLAQRAAVAVAVAVAVTQFHEQRLLREYSCMFCSGPVGRSRSISTEEAKLQALRFVSLKSDHVRHPEILKLGGEWSQTLEWKAKAFFFKSV